MWLSVCVVENNYIYIYTYIYMNTIWKTIYNKYNDFCFTQSTKVNHIFCLISYKSIFLNVLPKRQFPKILFVQFQRAVCVTVQLHSPHGKFHMFLWLNPLGFGRNEALKCPNPEMSKAVDRCLNTNLICTWDRARLCFSDTALCEWEHLCLIWFLWEDF